MMTTSDPTDPEAQKLAPELVHKENGETEEASWKDHEREAMDPRSSSDHLPEPTKGAQVSSDEASWKELAQRAPWVRAALLGAQDGLVSVTSLMVGVHAISGHRSSMVISGLAGLIAGACSMAIGEYVSVASERDIQVTALQNQKDRLEAGAESAESELEKLTQFYTAQGVSYSVARQVAEELSVKNPLKAHAQGEMGIDMDDLPNPTNAAMASAVCFVVGAVVPLVTAASILTNWLRVLLVLLVSSVMFVAFGFFGAWLGGAPTKRAALRTLFGGWVAIAITYCILRLVAAIGISESVFMEEVF